MAEDEQQQAVLASIAYNQFGVDMSDRLIRNSPVRTANFQIFNEAKFVNTIKTRYNNKIYRMSATKIQSWVRMKFA